MAAHASDAARQGAGLIATVESRSAIESALVALVGEHGIRATTVEELCERAGVERAAFDARYADLEDCFCQAFERLGEEFLVRTTAAFDAKLGWRDQLRALACAFLAYLQEDADRARLTVVEALFAGERAQLIRDRIFGTLYVFIDRGRQEMEDPEALSFATAESVGGAIFNQMRIEIEAGRLGTIEELVPRMMYTAVLPYLGPEAAREELLLPPPARTGATAKAKSHGENRRSG